MHIKQLCIPLALVCSVSASLQAAEMEAQLIGDKWSWISANSASGHVVPSLWDIPLNLPVAEQVIPGAPKTNISSIQLTGPGGSVNVPISLAGMEYRLSRTGWSQSYPDNTAITQVNGNQVLVLGLGVGTTGIKFSPDAISPFTHYRPIMKDIDTNAWTKAFRDAKLTKGQYQGIVNMTVPYDYFRGGIRIRNTLLLTNHIVVDYEPAILNTISVEGDGLINPIYHFPNTVSGKTEYVVNASGYFPNGILMGLKPPLSGTSFYEMKGKNPSEAIKYDVSCVSGCSGKNQIIVNGQGRINTTDNRMKIDAASPTTAQARLQISFNNKPMSEVSNDTYRDSFVLVFEAAL